jgi:hypothetical protein
VACAVSSRTAYSRTSQTTVCMTDVQAGHMMLQVPHGICLGCLTSERTSNPPMLQTGALQLSTGKSKRSAARRDIRLKCEPFRRLEDVGEIGFTISIGYPSCRILAAQYGTVVMHVRLHHPPPIVTTIHPIQVCTTLNQPPSSPCRCIYAMPMPMLML